MWHPNLDEKTWMRLYDQEITRAMRDSRGRTVGADTRPPRGADDPCCGAARKPWEYLPDMFRAQLRAIGVRS